MYLTIYLYVLFFYIPVDGHLDCFKVLAILHNAAVNTDVQFSVWTLVLEQQYYMIVVFLTLRN